MPHLNDTEFVDLLEGALASSRMAHASACPECTARLDSLRATLASVASDTPHEPSPLFWNAFPTRVATAIDQQSRPTSWLTRPVFAAVACAAALLIVIGVAALWPSSDRRAPVTSTTLAQPGVAAVDAGVLAEDDVEQDAAWAVVRIAADDLDYDDAVAAGITADAGAAERAAMELTGAERAELVRLIEREMKRSGA